MDRGSCAHARHQVDAGMFPIETNYILTLLTSPILLLSKHSASVPQVDNAFETRNMARPKLTVYLDVVSPFGYMAFYMTRVSALELFTLYSYLAIRCHDQLLRLWMNMSCRHTFIGTGALHLADT